MGSRKVTSVVLALAACALVLPAVVEARPRGGRWELLGERTVSDKLETDSLVVTGARGTFRSLQLRVLDRPVQFRDMKIHFANGETQDVALRDQIRAGGASRVIDVAGRDRVIRSIEFRYDAQSLLGRTARVRVYGRN